MCRGSTVRLDAKALKEAEANALYGLYTGAFVLKEVEEAFPQCSRRTLGAKLGALPRGLEDTETSLALTRAVNTICGVKRRQCYTDAELRQAAYEHKRQKNTKSVKTIEKEYGISKSALLRLCKRLEKDAGRKPSDAKLKETAESLVIKRPGRQPYLLDTENALLFERNAQRGDVAEGLTRQGMCADAARMVQAIGAAAEKAGAAPAHVERLKNAKCGSSWLQRNKKKALAMVPHGNFVKASAVSYKRAAAASPELNDAIFDHIYW
eukprot:CAMPEP_0118920990 /NCGR_PEP_ID=MMETSP1169-20130426/402_1 /TAXON_ID=36882 /ORGANISM="Pyramimonas obovata, Strain CCMP722" /LENGTH=265 /DNA_ID=CAMNT_0006861635 /DNA_START=134 /DNA_END=928 /DNA_ORIENTATION=+